MDSVYMEQMRAHTLMLRHARLWNGAFPFKTLNLNKNRKTFFSLLSVSCRFAVVLFILCRLGFVCASCSCRRRDSVRLNRVYSYECVFFFVVYAYKLFFFSFSLRLCCSLFLLCLSLRLHI